MHLMAAATTRRRLLVSIGLAALLPISPARASQDANLANAVLLGDSTFDNRAYVAEGTEVVAQLRRHLPDGWRATLLARDGAELQDVHLQLSQVPSDASALIISAGGNDALRSAAVLTQAAISVGEAVGMLADIRDRFGRDYVRLLDMASRLGLPIAVCTIYNANFPDPAEDRLAATALTLLNDVITLEASRRRHPIVDLRAIFSEPADYANPIEPSARGGAKVAAVLGYMLHVHDFSGPAALYAG